MRIGFIGLGNMATAIIGGMLRENTVLGSSATPLAASDIIGSAKTRATRDAKAGERGIAVSARNRQVAPSCSAATRTPCASFAACRTRRPW